MGCPKVHHEIVPPALFYLTELTGCIKHTARLFWFGVQSSRVAPGSYADIIKNGVDS